MNSPHRRVLLRQCLAELAGTFFLLLIGVSSNIQSTSISISSSTSSDHQLGPALAWGLALAFGLYLSAPISGGHLNPALSLAAFSYGHISPLQFALYLPSQLLGACLGSLLAFLGHFDDCRLIRARLGDHALAAQFATFPRPGLSSWGAVADQLLGTAILAVCCCAASDARPRGHRVPPALAPLLIGLSLTTIALSFGQNAGFAVNPARDLGPRLFLLFIGLGFGPAFSDKDFHLYFWIPALIPFLGAMIGAWVYKQMVGGDDRRLEVIGDVGSPVRETWGQQQNEDAKSPLIRGHNIEKLSNYASTSKGI